MTNLVGSGEAFETHKDDQAMDKEEDEKGPDDDKDKPDASMESDNEDTWEDGGNDVEWMEERGLVKVLRAFTLLQEQFNGKFKKMWA